MYMDGTAEVDVDIPRSSQTTQELPCECGSLSTLHTQTKERNASTSVDERLFFFDNELGIELSNNFILVFCLG